MGGEGGGGQGRRGRGPGRPVTIAGGRDVILVHITSISISYPTIPLVLYSCSLMTSLLLSTLLVLSGLARGQSEFFGSPRVDAARADAYTVELDAGALNPMGE